MPFLREVRHHQYSAFDNRPPNHLIVYLADQRSAQPQQKEDK